LYAAEKSSYGRAVALDDVGWHMQKQMSRDHYVIFGLTTTIRRNTK